ncbi:unnamed protein product, partial [Mycena citricolor]
VCIALGSSSHRDRRSERDTETRRQSDGTSGTGCGSKQNENQLLMNYSIEETARTARRGSGGSRVGGRGAGGAGEGER